MSAFIVSDDHIAYLVTAAFDYNRGGTITLSMPCESAPYGVAHIDIQNRSTLGQILLQENTNSVQYRYPDSLPFDLPGPIPTPIPDRYLYRRSPVPVTPVQVIKALRCYRYQSCEHPGWETSLANRFVEWLISQAHEHMAGMSDAMWEIDNDRYLAELAEKRRDIARRTA